jgi:putative molybdopterin biosynthesis protein
MEVLSAKDLSGYLKINEKKIYQLVREGKLPATRIGGKIAFAREIIDAWITENTERERHLFLAGSDDLLLRKIIDAYNAEGDSVIFYAPVGSINGLKLLKRRAANLSCVHILDVEARDYTATYLDRYLTREHYVAVHLYFREQGLYVEKGNPKKVQSLEDIAEKGLTFVNRNNGSGTRLLFDFLLNEKSIPSQRIRGYDGETAGSHLEAGLSVLTGKANISFGIRHIANLLNLHFIPLYKERFDLIIPDDYYQSDQVRHFLAFFDQGRLVPYVKDFAGYDTTRTGNIIHPHV